MQLSGLHAPDAVHDSIPYAWHMDKAWHLSRQPRKSSYGIVADRTVLRKSNNRRAVRRQKSPRAAKGSGVLRKLRGPTAKQKAVVEAKAQAVQVPRASHPGSSLEDLY